jgi:phosphatidylglycerophosphatase A
MMLAMAAETPAADRPLCTGHAFTVVATGLGAGYSPLAPGTFGSAVGVLLFWPAHGWPLWAQVAGTALFFAGVAASGRLATLLGKGPRPRGHRRWPACGCRC